MTERECPIQLAIDARRPPEAQLSPFPQDALVEPPAPRPSLAPFGVLTGDEQTRRGNEAHRIHRASPRAGSADTEYVELHARSAFSFLRGSSLPEDLAHAAAATGHGVF